MKKKILGLALVFLIIFAVFSQKTFAVEKDVKLWIHGEYVETDIKPLLENGRTLVPVRVISEALGYDVNWNEDLFKVTISNFDKDENIFNKLFVLTINNKTIVDYDIEKVNKLFTKKPSPEELSEILKESANAIETDVAPKIIEKRTFVPLRVIAELMGEKVDWDEKNFTVVIGDGYTK